MAEQAIFDALSAIPALGNRVYPLVLPQNAEYPAVVFQRISGTRYSAFSRDAAAVEATIQVDIYAHRTSGFPSFRSTTEAVRAALQRHSTTTVFDMMLEGERDDFEDETGLFRKSYDVRAWYREL